jgi:hypothetical protein
MRQNTHTGGCRYAQTLVLLAMVLGCAVEAPLVAIAGVLCLTLRFVVDKFHHLQVLSVAAYPWAHIACPLYP